MTPQEKAKELVAKFLFLYRPSMHPPYLKANEVAKEGALIAVDELIKETHFEVPNIRQRYWQEVKQEIDKL